MRPFVERGGRPSAKGRDRLSREGGGRLLKEGGSRSSRQGSPSAKGRTRLLSMVEGQPFVERGQMPAVRREREDTSHSSREGDGAIRREREDQAVHLEREDASAREGGCRSFVERGRTLAVHREREVAVH